jgi:hypothetical protein
MISKASGLLRQRPNTVQLGLYEMGTHACLCAQWHAGCACLCKLLGVVLCSRGVPQLQNQTGTQPQKTVTPLWRHSGP